MIQAYALQAWKRSKYLHFELKGLCLRKHSLHSILRALRCSASAPNQLHEELCKLIEAEYLALSNLLHEQGDLGEIKNQIRTLFFSRLYYTL